MHVLVIGHGPSLDLLHHWGEIARRAWEQASPTSQVRFACLPDDARQGPRAVATWPGARLLELQVAGCDVEAAVVPGRGSVVSADHCIAAAGGDTAVAAPILAELANRAAQEGPVVLGMGRVTGGDGGAGFLARWSQSGAGAADVHDSPTRVVAAYFDEMPLSGPGGLVVRTAQESVRTPGSGAGGGLGYALARSGCPLVPAARALAELVGLAQHVEWADLVVELTEVMGRERLRDGVGHEAAQTALAQGRSLMAIAASAEISRREWAAAGLSGLYELDELLGGDDAALARRFARLAHTWTW